MHHRNRERDAKDGSKKITFVASLPATGYPIKLDGYGDEVEIRLVVPRSDSDKVLEIWQEWAQRVLRVTVEVDG